MLFASELELPGAAMHVLGDEQEAERRLRDANEGDGNVPEVDGTAVGLVLRWSALPAETAWQAVTRMGAIARLLVDDFDEHAVLRVSVQAAVHAEP